MKQRLILKVSLLFFASCPVATSQEVVMSPELQASLFAKIFTFDDKLRTTEQITVSIVYNNRSTKLKNGMVKAFEALKTSVGAVKVSELSENMETGSVLYIAPGVGSIKQICKANGLLSITAIPELVEAGEASVGVYIENYKPRIIVHLGQLEAEGHSLSSKLLRLAKVIHAEDPAKTQDLPDESAEE